MAKKRQLRPGADAVARRIQSRHRKVMTAIESVLRRHGVDARIKELHMLPTNAEAVTDSGCPEGTTPTVVCRKGPDGRTVCSTECR